LPSFVCGFVLTPASHMHPPLFQLFNMFRDALLRCAPDTIRKRLERHMQILLNGVGSLQGRDFGKFTRRLFSMLRDVGGKM